MSYEDPPRLVDFLDAPEELRSLLDSAHNDTATPAMLDRITAGVVGQMGPPTPPSQGGSGGPASGAAAASQVVKAAAVAWTKVAVYAGATVVVAGVVGGLAIGLGYRAAGTPSPADSATVASATAGGSIASSASPLDSAVEVAAAAESPSEPSRGAETASGHPTDISGQSTGSRVAAKKGDSMPIGSSSTGDPPLADGRQSVASQAMEEHRMLRDARAALAGNPQRALDITAEHRQRFPRGMLAEEREVIAIEALSRLGRTSAAQSRAHQFAGEHPGSAYRQRVDRIVSDGGTKP